ncbi:WcaI family glycosyltransferase [Phenylobacterium sp.]|uniref:WcaI family glycosyltransferase n=1 Tax=Phenylobacterium sp. TaxID=1871053 RepID=UPI0035B47505
MKKRVVIYGINYAPEIAGVGRYTGEIGAYLASQGHDVCAITAPPHYPGWRLQQNSRVLSWRAEELDGVRVYRCPLYLTAKMHGLRRLLAPLSFALSSAPVAFAQILKRRPDVVIVVEPTLFVAPVAVLAARLVGARTILHVQDLEVEAAFAMGHLRADGPLKRLASWFDRKATAAFDQVVTISNRMAEKIVRKGVDPSKLTIVRNWVDVEAVRPMPTAMGYRQELGIPTDKFVALYSGNIGAKQGVRVVLEAARELADRSDILVVIAGQGPMRAEVAAQAAILPNLQVLDFQPESRFSEFLSIADAHLLPQEKDAADLLLPSKLGGMLASGRPVIVTADAQTELAEFLGDTCVFSPPGDAQALARSLESLQRGHPVVHQEPRRIQLAQALAKSTLIRAFTEAVLPPSPTNRTTSALAAA